MDDKNTQRLLAEIADLVALKSVTLTPDTIGKQFMFVSFSQVISGFDVKHHTLEDVIQKVDSGDSDVGHILVGLDYAEIDQIRDEKTYAKIGDFLSARLYRHYTPYPEISPAVSSEPFTWRTTVKDVEAFNVLFLSPDKLNRPVYDFVYILYQLAKHNDLLGLYGSSLIKQFARHLGEFSEFEWELYDKLLALSNVLNKKNKKLH